MDRSKIYPIPFHEIDDYHTKEQLTELVYHYISTNRSGYQKLLPPSTISIRLIKVLGLEVYTLLSAQLLWTTDISPDAVYAEFVYGGHTFRLSNYTDEYPGAWVITADARQSWYVDDAFLFHQLMYVLADVADIKVLQ